MIDPNRILEDIRTKVTAEHGDAAVFADVEDVHLSVLAAYKAAATVRIYNGATRKSYVGQIALARGPRPSFLLIEPKWKGGVIPLGHNDVVVARRVNEPGSKAKWITMAKVENRNGSEH